MLAACAPRVGVERPPPLVIMAQKPESRIVKSILKSIRGEGGWWFKTHGSPYQMAGLPDIIGCHKGRFVGFEVKRPEHEMDTSPRQELTMKRISDAGGIVAVVSSVSGALGVLYILDVEKEDK